MVSRLVTTYSYHRFGRSRQLLAKLHHHHRDQDDHIDVAIGMIKIYHFGQFKCAAFVLVSRVCNEGRGDLPDDDDHHGIQY